MHPTLSYLLLMSMALSGRSSADMSGAPYVPLCPYPPRPARPPTPEELERMAVEQQREELRAARAQRRPELKRKGKGKGPTCGQRRGHR